MKFITLENFYTKIIYGLKINYSLDKTDKEYFLAIYSPFKFVSCYNSYNNALIGLKKAVKSYIKLKKL